MVQLTDYLYSGDTVLKILHGYSADLRKSAGETGNQVDLVHADFLSQMIDMLEQNDFITSQSQRLREFYKYMAQQYPYLAFTFHGRIKSLIRAEEKFNGYISNFIYEYYQKHREFPPVSDIKDQVKRFRDLIAYRIVICMPKCHLKPGQDREEVELGLLYEIANKMPGFLEDYAFTPELADKALPNQSPLMDEKVRPYYKDYIENVKDAGYRSLHIALYDQMSKSYIEMQLRTKTMDDFAEIGNANHAAYEKAQKKERTRRQDVPEGECIYFDEAYERVLNLQNLDLSKVDVNMFTAASNILVNDGCGLYRGRQILPYEHLSCFQNDEID